MRLKKLDTKVSDFVNHSEQKTSKEIQNLDKTIPVHTSSVAK